MSKDLSTPHDDNLRSPANNNYHNQEKDVAVLVGKEYDEVEQGPRRKRFFCWRLTKKQWILSLVGLILGILLVVFLIIWFAVIPAVFQKKLDAVELSLSHFDLLKLESDPSTNTAGIELQIHVKTDGSVNAVMDSTTATLYYKDRPFTTLTLPEQNIRKDTPEYDITIKDTAVFSDVAVFRELSRDVVINKEVEIRAKASPTIHAFGLSGKDLDLDRTITARGIWSFNDPAAVINEMKVTGCPVDEITMAVNITIDNASQIGLNGIGTLNMTLYYEQDKLGYAVMRNGERGMPRGPIDYIYDVHVSREESPFKIFKNMLIGILSGKSQMYITGEHEGATKAYLLGDALKAYNQSILYTDGLEKVTQDPDCDLTKIALG
ncbi:hypothetical protein Poli38472_005435 [Pythium oligandrum]|uniref:Uncharacterized protein n=1 Tax=Pythium oligandrum TaxID=41045 RepID=A0A8K1CIK5_PYTOL|nr:hypothetical protein Poli38472_005435 [Pythium oligandrum]|eukprot:TMW62817.1 hypothetical protein Poli38472_005435 [Pythium oligandrum]